MGEDTPVEHDPQPASDRADWEYDLSPERAVLKELAQLITAIMGTVMAVEKPEKLIAGYADEILRRHSSELPQSAIKELHQKRNELLQRAEQSTRR